MKKRLQLFLLCLFLAPGFFHPWTSEAHILDVAARQYVSFQAMVQDLKEARLIFMGELHDNVGHHRAQLQVIRALHEAGVPVAIGVEMFRQKDQEILDRWVRGDISEKEFIPVFNRNWSMWPKYRDIFLFARRQNIPMVGLNIPRAITGQVAREGFSSLTPEQLGEIPAVRCDVDEKYMEFIRRTLGAHAHHGNSTFRNFCEAQALWDAAMAHNLLEYLSSNPDRRMVVLAGSGHSWKYGIPEQVQRRTNIETRVLLPEIEERLEAGNVSSNEADYLMMGLDQAPLH